MISDGSFVAQKYFWAQNRIITDCPIRATTFCKRINKRMNMVRWIVNVKWICLWIWMYELWVWHWTGTHEHVHSAWTENGEYGYNIRNAFCNIPQGGYSKVEKFGMKNDGKTRWKINSPEPYKIVCFHVFVYWCVCVCVWMCLPFNYNALPFECGFRWRFIWHGDGIPMGESEWNTDIS